MSILSDHVERCRRERDDAILDLDHRFTERARLVRKSMEMGSEVTQDVIKSLDREIEMQRAVVAKRCQDFTIADAALDAEKKSEKEMSREAERQMALEQPRAKENEIDDLER